MTNGREKSRDPEAVAFGLRLRRYLDAAGLHPKELASRIGRSSSYVRSMLVGIKGPPGRETLERIARVLDISVDALLGLEPEEEVIQEIQLRRGLSLVGTALGENHETLLRLYEHRREIEHGKLPAHVKARILSRIDEIIREYQSLNREGRKSP